jgi:hypothetical protein
MYLFNNIKFNPDIQRTIGDTQYPAGWFNNADERAKIGVIEVSDPVMPDESLFTVVENADGSYTATPRTADDIAAYQANKNNQQAKSVRTSRGEKLKDSDWTQVADAPVDKAAWATYRQALRDVTGQQGFPWTITWPTQPE